MARETKRQCRILKISDEHNTSVNIADEIWRLDWIPHFAVKLLNKRRIGRRWTKTNVQLEKKVRFQKIEEEGVNSTLKRRVQRLTKGQQNRTRAIPYIAKSGGERGHSWIRQTLSDAWESMNLEDWFGDLGHVMTRVACNDYRDKNWQDASKW